MSLNCDEILASSYTHEKQQIVMSIKSSKFFGKLSGQAASWYFLHIADRQNFIYLVPE